MTACRMLAVWRAKFRPRLAIGGLIQAVGVAFALQIRTPPSRRRNLHLMLDTVP